DELIEFGAGGPLVRFGIEYDEPARASDKRAEAAAAPVKNATRPATAPSDDTRANNLWLLIALVAAMLIGAAGGIALSPRRGASFIEIARQNSPAVVFIRSQYTLLDSGGQAIVTDSRTGTGFVVSSSGLIVTNRHLIRDWEYNPTFAGATGRTDRIEVIFPDSRREDVILAQVYSLSTSTETDLAILKIDPPAGMPVVRSLGSGSEQVSQGAEVAVLGYPLGLDLLNLTGETLIAPSLSAGVVSRASSGIIQLSLRAYNGNSGGPVFDHHGRVIGVLTANVRSAQDLTLCTPIQAATDLITDESQR
ncbi:MAG TPA: serine protease, partial [Blastocatellia bacterium]|nr:serine protease [Blastocatellia bacterium]